MTENPKSSVAVIVVNYGTAELSIAGVESVLAREHGGRRVTVHLVDNASPGEDARAFAEAHAARGWGDRVQLHLEPANHGFAKGNNIVMKALAASEAPPTYIFLLNPDAALDNEALAILADRMDADPKLAFTGASVCKPDGTAVTAAFRFPNAAAEFAGALSFGPISRLFAKRRVALPPDQPDGPVDWVVGAAVMMELSVVEELGFFDETYFLYFEEVDLMLQAQKAGYRCDFVPEARVIHAEGVATGVKSGVAERKRTPGYWYNSWRHYFAKNHGRGGALLAALAKTVGSAGNLVVGLLPGKRTSVPLNFFGDFWAHVLRPLITGRAPRDG